MYIYILQVSALPDRIHSPAECFLCCDIIGGRRGASWLPAGSSRPAVFLNRRGVTVAATPPTPTRGEYPQLCVGIPK